MAAVTRLAGLSSNTRPVTNWGLVVVGFGRGLWVVRITSSGGLNTGLCGLTGPMKMSGFVLVEGEVVVLVVVVVVVVVVSAVVAVVDWK